jgi:hypothetical protein
MTPQLGDHFAQGADSYASPAERHLGIPHRDRDIEDRAQEARRAVRWIRGRSWVRLAQRYAIGDVDAFSDIYRYLPGDSWRAAHARQCGEYIQ